MSPVRRFLAALGIVSLWPCLVPGAVAQGTGGFYVEPITADDAFRFPTDVVRAPDGRYYVTQKEGLVRVVEPDGTVLPTPFLDLTSEVEPTLDRGLLGIALHPDFPATPYVYLHYVARDPTSPDSLNPDLGFGRVTRYALLPGDPTRADLTSRKILIGESYEGAPVSCLPYHAGGTVAFAHDGTLLLSFGEGAEPAQDVGGLVPACFDDGRGDPANDIGMYRSQRLESLNGKLLRVDPETGLGLSDNPFYTGDPADPVSKVWALGLRNPFRFAIAPDDGAGTRVAIGDVGRAAWEEISVARGGENFGWPCYEGTAPVDDIAAAAPPGYGCTGPWTGELTFPVATWSHYVGAESSPPGLVARSITGGAFYTGEAYPEPYWGALFFADYARQWVMVARLEGDRMTAGEPVVLDVGGIVDVEMDAADGTLVLVDLLGGRLLRLRSAEGGGLAPVARAAVERSSGAAPFEARFTGSESLDPDGSPLTYAWSFGDRRSTSIEADPVHTYTEPGRYIATLTVTDADGRQSQVTVPVAVGRAAPEVDVVEPSARVARGSELVPLEVAVSDPYEPAEALDVQWEVRVVHNDHEHPGYFNANGPRAAFRALPHGDGGELVFYRATVTVTDGEGVEVSRSVAVPMAAAGDVLGVVDADGAATEGFLFGRTERVRSVLIPGVDRLPPDYEIELLVDGTWQPALFPHTAWEPTGVRVLFVATKADGVRVRGAGEGVPRVRIHMGPEAALPSGVAVGHVGEGWEGPFVARGSDGSIGLTGRGRTSAEGDAYPFVHTAVEPATSVSALAATPSAGIALRASLDPRADAVVLSFTPTGRLVLAARAEGVFERDTLDVGPPPLWLRLTPTAGGPVQASVSTDGDAWRRVGWVGGWTSSSSHGGLIIESGGASAVAW